MIHFVILDSLSLYKKKNSKKIEKFLLKCKKKIVSVTFLIFDHHSKCRICCNNLSSGLVFIYHPDLIAFIFNYTKKKSKKDHKNFKTWPIQFYILFLYWSY